MAVAGKSSDELLKALPAWKQSDFNEFWKIGWRSGSKQQAVVAWERAIKDRDQSTMVVAAAKRYKDICAKNDTPLTMAATWLNQARWETVPAVKPEHERVSAVCACGREAQHDTGDCDACWADKYSYQLHKGEFVAYKPLLAQQLKAMDLWIKDGETRSDFSDRCRAEFHRRHGNTLHFKAR